ncbi:MAG: hypothetical protein Q9224_007210, partial [Gallowayella concinna]
MYSSLLTSILAAISSVASPLLARATCAAPQDSDLTAAKKAIYDSKLVPDIISSFNPSLLIRAAYKTKAVTLGNSSKPR